jgi:biopolymer transport protein ExbB
MWTIITKGGLIMYPLLLCSIIAFTVVLERAVFWWLEGRRTDEERCREVVNLAGQGRFDQAGEICRDAPDAVGRVLAAGLEHMGAGPARAMEQAAAAEVRRMRRLMVVLDSMITIAPLLGILGTVTGIIHSFDMLGVDPNVGSPREVVSGIAQALITTAAGLTIAVCCLFPFNYFQHRTEHTAATLENWGTRLELTMLRNGGRA